MSKNQKRLGRGLDSLVSRLIDRDGAPQTPPADAARNTLPRAANAGSAPPLDAVSRETNLHPAATGTGAKSVSRETDLRDTSSRPLAADAIAADGSKIPAIRVENVAIDRLRSNRFQPRLATDEAGIAALAASIKQSGILQPIAVRPAGDAFEIIAGERRWLAATALRMPTVPVIIRNATDEQMLELALVENIQRVDLNPVDRARAYQRFCKEFRLPVEEVARRVGEDRSTVSNYLRLLELPEEILALVADGRVSQGHARAILSEPDGATRVRLAELAAKNALSVRALEEVIRRGRAMQSANGVALLGGAAALGDAKLKLRSAHLRDLERRFEEALKTKVTIHEGRRKGSGRITIEYFSLDDFERVMEQLGVKED